MCGYCNPSTLRCQADSCAASCNTAADCGATSTCSECSGGKCTVPAQPEVTPKFSAAAVFGIAMGAGVAAIVCAFGTIALVFGNSVDGAYVVVLGGAGVFGCAFVVILVVGLVLGLSPSMCCK